MYLSVSVKKSTYKELFKNGEMHFFNTTNDFIHSNIWSDFHDMFILLKGARSFSFREYK
jgi:hypothetical protein